jgi:hypothetical protein
MELHDLLRRKPWQKMIFDVGLDDEPRTYLRGRLGGARGSFAGNCRLRSMRAS